MKRKRPDIAQTHRTGFTLVELLVATTLALMLMGAVVVMVGAFGNSITDSRSMLESADRLRLAESRLQMDLAGITATVSPSLKPENNEGYFEYVEGPVGVPIPPMTSLMPTPGNFAVNIDNASAADQTVGDFDDILMFTTRSTGKPFVGRYYNPTSTPPGPATIESDVAEVAWFLRGHTLHRRVLLVVPNVVLTGTPAPFYNYNDISARVRGSVLVPNTLGDLTRRECRFAHPSTGSYDARLWRWNLTSSPATIFPTLPTLQECTSAGWTTEHPTPGSPYSQTTFDMWTNTVMPENAFGTSNLRISDDIILTNVIGFDVKAWDPTAPNGMGGLGAYVDLGYQNETFPPTISRLSHIGNSLSGLAATATLPSRVYDTWSTTYYGDFWNDGLDNGTVGSNGIVDDDAEKTFPPPYPIPLRGIQVKIRVFEPDSKQVREVTVEQDFLPR